jgi:hypothetical protein
MYNEIWSVFKQNSFLELDHLNEKEEGHIKTKLLKQQLYILFNSLLNIVSFFIKLTLDKQFSIKS